MRTLALSFLVACSGADDAAKDDTGAGDTADTADTSDTADTADTADTGADEVLVASVEEGGRTVELWAPAALHTGLNTVTFRVLDGASPVDGLPLTNAPLMDMGDMQHACPYTAPVAAGDGRYTSEVVYQMAGAWMDSVSDGTTTFAFSPLEVAETGAVQVIAVGEQSWVVSFNLAGEPVVGDNPFVLTVHRKEDMMSWPEIAGLTVDVEPTMPSMGHGSTGNVDPTYTSAGKYEGSVNFSMRGAWEVTFSLDDGAGNAPVVIFDVSV